MPFQGNQGDNPVALNGQQVMDDDDEDSEKPVLADDYGLFMQNMEIIENEAMDGDESGYKASAAYEPSNMNSPTIQLKRIEMTDNEDSFESIYKNKKLRLTKAGDI